MQHDDTIWSVISQGFCSFKAKLRDDVGHAGAKTEAFCRNPYNSTGICSRVNCPLANSQYATVIEKDNQLYLYMKTVERAHTPKRLWEKILLPNSFKEALELINDNLQWWDRKVVMKCKHRLLRLKQVLIRKRRLAMRGVPKLVGIKKKEEKQLARKEAKAEKAAKVTSNIQKTLLSRQSKRSLDISDADLQRLADDIDEKDEKQRKEAETEGVDGAGGEADLVSDDGDDDGLVPYCEDSTDSESWSDEEEEEEEDAEEESEEEVEAGGKKRQHVRIGAPSSGGPARKKRRVEIEHEKEMDVCGLWWEWGGGEQRGETPTCDHTHTHTQTRLKRSVFDF